MINVLLVEWVDMPRLSSPALSTARRKNLSAARILMWLAPSLFKNKYPYGGGRYARNLSFRVGWIGTWRVVLVPSGADFRVIARKVICSWGMLLSGLAYTSPISNWQIAPHLSPVNTAISNINLCLSKDRDLRIFLISTSDKIAACPWRLFLAITPKKITNLEFFFC